MPELKQKLLRCRGVTQWLGRTREVQHDSPREFRRLLERYMDSSNEVSDGSFW